MTPIFENLTLAVLDGRTVVRVGEERGEVYASLLPLPGGGKGWFKPDGTRIWHGLSESNAETV